MPRLLPAGWLWLAAVLFVIGGLYFPGLAGGFLLDDWANLKPLERLQAWGFGQGLPSMLASNPAGDLGRPIPLLTFALQYADWPGNPAAFKQGNLAIHLFNVLLVWAWAQLLWENVRPQSGPRLAALPLLLALAWGIHPLFVSTVLYVVQRMALLAGTFMLAGLLAYTLGRLRWAAGGRHGLLLMAAGLLLGTGLGALCKENALLLPGLVGVLEWTLFAGLRRPRGWGALVLLGCLLPSLALIGFIGLRFESWILPGYGIREYDPAERLMTEARILWNYLGLAVLPLPWQLGLFHDDFAISRSMLEPRSTLPAVIGVAGLVLCVVIGRRRMPAAAFAIGGFLWGHALESGPIPLELYFEHRNYLPGLFLILGGGMGLMAWSAGRTKPAKASWPAWRYGLLSLGLWLGFLSLVTLQETRLWGNPDVQADLWAQRRPDSLRANAYLGERLEHQGFIKAAGQLYGRMEARDPAMVLARAKIDCRLGLSYDPERYRGSLARVPSMRFSRNGLAGVEQLMLLATEHNLCTDFAAGLIPLAADAMRANPLLGRMHFHLWVLEGRYRLGSGRPIEARAAFGSALALRPDVEVALLAVQADARGGNIVAAQRSLGLARAILAGYNPVRRRAYEKDVAALTAALAAPARETR